MVPRLFASLATPGLCKHITNVLPGEFASEIALRQTALWLEF